MLRPDLGKTRRHIGGGAARDIGQDASRATCRGRRGIEERGITRVAYEIIEHDGGWAYKVGDVFSEPFPSHDAARRAAERAAHDGSSPANDGHFVRGQGWPLARRTVGRFRPAETDVEG